MGAVLEDEIPKPSITSLRCSATLFKAPLTSFMGSAVKGEVLSKYDSQSSVHSVVQTEVPVYHVQATDSQCHTCTFGSVRYHSLSYSFHFTFLPSSLHIALVHFASHTGMYARSS